MSWAFSSMSSIAKEEVRSWADFYARTYNGFHVSVLEVNKDDKVLDATCGSGGFLVKAVANAVFEAGGAQANKAKKSAISTLRHRV